MLNKPLHIAISGVESTGKTTLSKDLGDALSACVVSEIARNDERVIAGNARLADLQRLGEEQLSACREIEKSAQLQGIQFVISDTDSTVLRMWGRWAFKEEVAGLRAFDEWPHLTLLCAPNIPWEADPLRTLPRQSDRNELHEMYVEDLKSRSNRSWALIDDLTPQKRLEQSVRAVQSFLSKSRFSE